MYISTNHFLDELGHFLVTIHIHVINITSCRVLFHSVWHYLKTIIALALHSNCVAKTDLAPRTGSFPGDLRLLRVAWHRFCALPKCEDRFS